MSAALAFEPEWLSEKPRLGKKVVWPRLVWENPVPSAGKHKGKSKVKGKSSYGRVLYMKARIYDANIGRFMSADTLIPDPTLSQDFNRYTYTRSNPLRYTDPTGHAPSPDIFVSVLVRIGSTGSITNIGGFFPGSQILCIQAPCGPQQTDLSNCGITAAACGPFGRGTRSDPLGRRGGGEPISDEGFDDFCVVFPGRCAEILEGRRRRESR